MSGDVTLPSTTRLVVDTDNRLLLGGHRLEVGGDLYVRVSDYSADGIRLLDPNDVLVVEGDATFTSRGYNHSATSEGNFIAGTAYFRGDFSQTRESSGAEKSFVSTGTKVVFDGSAAQTVYFSHPSTGGSRFAELELRNTAGISTNTLVADDPVLVSTGASVTTTGSVTFGDTFTVDGGTMVVTATPTITGKVTVSNAGSLTFNGEPDFNDDVDVLGASTLSFGNSADFAGLVQVQGGSTLTGNEGYFESRLPEIDSSTYTVTSTRPEGTLIMPVSITLPTTTTLEIHRQRSLTLNGKTLTLNGPLWIEISDTASDGLLMNNANDLLYLNGDATFSSGGYNHSATTEGSFTNGTIYSRGDFTQARPSNAAAKSFVSTGTKVIFDGSSAQSIQFSSPSTTASRFDEVDFTNTAGFSTSGLVMDGAVLVDSSVSVSVGGPLTLGDTLDVDGGTLSVTGTTTIDGEITVDNAGTLTLGVTNTFPSDVDVVNASTMTYSGSATFNGLVEIQGGSSLTGTEGHFTTRLPEISSATYDVTTTFPEGNLVLPHDITLPSTTTLYINRQDSVRLNGKTLTLNGPLYVELSDTSGDGLIMTNAADVLYLNDDVTWSSGGLNHSATSEGNFSHGTIYSRADFTQARPSGAAPKSFVSTGTKVVFDGSSQQSVQFSSATTEASRFDEVDFLNTADFTTSALVADGAVTVPSGVTVTVGGGLTLGDSLSVSGGAISVSGTFTTSGTISLTNAATLTLGVTNAFPEAVDVLSGSAMSYSGSATFEDLVRVEGSSSLSGTEGHFTTRLPEIASSTYNVTTTFPEGNLSLPNDITLPSTTTLNVNRQDSLRLNGHTLTLNGSLYVELSDTSGDGLIMTNSADLLYLNDDVTWSSGGYNHSATSEGNFTQGTIYVRADFDQDRPSGAAAKSFVSTGTKVIFDGSTAQSANFSSSTSSASRLDDFDVSNATGLSFTSAVYASGDLDLIGKLTTSTGAFTLAGTMTLRSTGHLVNGGNISVGGCVKESGHTITGTDPCP